MSVVINGTGSISGLSNVGGIDLPQSGSVLQVVNAIYNAAQNTTTSSTFVDTNLTATITPKFATSKILVLVSQTGLEKGSADIRVALQLVRGSTALIFMENEILTTGTTASSTGSSSTSYLDSPATTSATTYKTQIKVNQGTGTVAWNASNNGVPAATITLLEIAQ